MRCYAYVRVSTREQDEEVQIKAIEEFARSRGVEVVEYFIDKGESGAKRFSERPAARQLLDMISKGAVDCVVTWSIDRLGRTMLDTLSTVVGLEEIGVKVLSVREEWLQTLDDNVRRLILSILSWVAEWERRRIRERQEEAWRQGKQKGRPRKVRAEVVRKYLERYRNLSLKDVWRIMRGDGINISYTTLRRYVKELRTRSQSSF